MDNQQLKKYFPNAKRIKNVDKDGNYRPLTESELHSAIIAWMKKNYPQVRVTSTLNGEKFGKLQALRVKKNQSHQGVPDIIIHHNNGLYPILYLELKKDGTKLFKKDGTLLKNEHIEEQADYINYLRSQGYCADFSIGYVDTIIKIKMYLDGDEVQYLY
jgi:hypothetical protein